MNQIFTHAAKVTQLLCAATRITLDAPRFEEQYVAFHLNETHGLDVDFFIRAQSVGITCKGEDIRLFYLLQDMVRRDQIQFYTTGGGVRKSFSPYLPQEGSFSMENPCTFYLAGISSGNLKGWSDIPISRDPSSFEARAEFLANLLFTQWIVKMMPVIETYKQYKRNGLLVPIAKAAW